MKKLILSILLVISPGFLLAQATHLEWTIAFQQPHDGGTCRVIWQVKDIDDNQQRDIGVSRNCPDGNIGGKGFYFRNGDKFFMETEYQGFMEYYYGELTEEGQLRSNSYMTSTNYILEPILTGFVTKLP